MHHLPSATISLLSSTQVITAVVNVVKELVENALDACANSIEIKLENFGFDRIEVRDNGQGIKAADTPVMAVKHYTSKITSHEDIETLQTYGFRGEALGSICSVAEVHITTKTAADEISTCYLLDSNGYILSQKPSHSGNGTTVSVLKLFKNLPVRKQFYSSTKKCKEELKKIQELLMAYGIIKPEVRIVFIHNKVIIWQKSKVSDHKLALMSVLGAAVMNSMISFHHQCDNAEISINGYLPKPEADSSLTSLSSPEKSFIFINQRPVHHKDILKMVRLYYNRKKDFRSYPVFFMNIVVPTSSLDVNITPDKSQVMLHNKESVLEALDNILKSVYPDTMFKTFDKADVQSKDVSCENEALEKANHCEKISFGIGDPEKHNANLSPSNSDVELVFNSVEQVTGPECIKDKIADVAFETTDDAWSKGNALKNARTENLQPFKIFCPLVANTAIEISDHTENTVEKTTNVVIEKPGLDSAYELTNNKVVKKPISVFTQELKTKFFNDIQKTGFDDMSSSIVEHRDKCSKYEKLWCEEKAAKDLHQYNVETARSSEKINQKPKETGKRPRLASAQNLSQKMKTKTPLSNQQILDKMFKSQTEKETLESTVKTVQIHFNLSGLKQQLYKLLDRDLLSNSEEIVPLRKLNFPDAWVITSKKKIMLFNPCKVEEVLLYKRLMDNHNIPADMLESPIVLNDRLFGDQRYLATLLEMKKDSPKPNGHIYFSDQRLCANGFLIKVVPGSTDVDKHVEIEGMTRSLPFYGLSDLKEILKSVMNNRVKLCDCRPLKVLHFLEGEAVRLARQLPLNLSKDDVNDTISRMKMQLEGDCKECLHGLPFFHYITDIPEDCY